MKISARHPQGGGRLKNPECNRTRDRHASRACAWRGPNILCSGIYYDDLGTGASGPTPGGAGGAVDPSGRQQVFLADEGGAPRAGAGPAVRDRAPRPRPGNRGNLPLDDRAAPARGAGNGRGRPERRSVPPARPAAVSSPADGAGAGRRRLPGRPLRAHGGVCRPGRRLRRGSSAPDPARGLDLRDRPKPHRPRRRDSVLSCNDLYHYIGIAGAMAEERKAVRVQRVMAMHKPPVRAPSSSRKGMNSTAGQDRAFVTFIQRKALHADMATRQSPSYPSLE